MADETPQAAGLYDLANRVMSHVEPDPSGARDVDIALIVLVIRTLIELYSCFRTSPSGAATACRIPGFSRMAGAAAVRSALPDASWAQRRRVLNALLAAGQTLTAADVEAALRDVDDKTTKF